MDPEGGFGDELILQGLEKKLNELKIKYRIVKVRKSSNVSRIVARAVDFIPGLQRIVRAMRPDVMEPRFRQLTRPVGEMVSASESVILIRGGGYLNDVWKAYGVIDSIAKAIRGKPHAIVIIAPHSFYFNDLQFFNVLGQLEQQVHIFCREIPSYDALSSVRMAKNVHVHLSQDTAFYLSRKDFHVRSFGKYVLIAARLDRESIMTWNVNEIRKLGMPTVMRDLELLPDFKLYVRTIAEASKVYTDRLHVAILSAILSKETYLFPNSYHKNRGVYEFSLKRFRNVKFISRTENSVA